jgi:hypothetical protein
MPTNKPFFHDLRQPKKVVTPKGEVLIRKTQLRQRIHGAARCEKCLARKVKRK